MKNTEFSTKIISIDNVITENILTTHDKNIIMKNNMETNSKNINWSQLRKIYPYKIKKQQLVIIILKNNSDSMKLIIMVILNMTR